MSGARRWRAAGLVRRPFSGPEAEQKQFARALRDMRGYASQRDCDQEQFQSQPTEGLAALSTGGAGRQGGAAAVAGRHRRRSDAGRAAPAR